MAPSAPYHIRKYQERDRKPVLSLYSACVAEFGPITFRYLLRLPRVLVLLLGAPLAAFLATSSGLLALLAGLSVLAGLRRFARYPWAEFEVMALRTDMADISRAYFSQRGSCFWVAESQGRVVGMVGALPVADAAPRKEQVELFHLCVASEHRGRGIAKALVRTVLQFGRDQGYGAVVLSTSMLQPAARGLYQRMGFRETRRYFHSLSWRALDIPFVAFIYHVPSQPQGGGL